MTPSPSTAECAATCDRGAATNRQAPLARALAAAPTSAAIDTTIFTVLGVAVLVAAAGCQDTNRNPRSQQFSTPEAQQQMNEQNLLYAISVLRNIEEAASPESLPTVVSRLNQWNPGQSSSDDWSLDPLIETLPEALRELPALRSLDQAQFPASDGLELQTAVWLNDVSEHARGDDAAALARAESLFDWVVRNIQLETDNQATVPYLPGQTLLLGRGTAEDRAWLFALVARQQGLDVVMLAIAGDDASGPPRFWLPALSVDGELYLFDARLGMPIPGPGGKGVATLRQVADDPGLLRALDLDDQHIYPVDAEDLARVVALVEGSPSYLTRRMQWVESHLPGKDTLVLSTRPSALAERLKSHPHVTDVRLWSLPYERLRRRAQLDDATRAKAERDLQVFREPSPLRKARVLHLLGEYDGEKGANALYQQARPSNADMEEARARATPQNKAQIDQALELMSQSKQYASYWLGLLALERGNYPAAIDYLKTRTLAAFPRGPWTHGARYNLARAYEANGDAAAAIAIYQADQSPQRHGSLLRARRLQETAVPVDAAEDTAPQPESDGNDAAAQKAAANGDSP